MVHLSKAHKELIDFVHVSLSLCLPAICWILKYWFTYGILTHLLQRKISVWISRASTASGCVSGNQIDAGKPAHTMDETLIDQLRHYLADWSIYDLRMMAKSQVYVEFSCWLPFWMLYKCRVRLYGCEMLHISHISQLPCWTTSTQARVSYTFGSTNEIAWQMKWIGPIGRLMSWKEERQFALDPATSKWIALKCKQIRIEISARAPIYIGHKTRWFYAGIVHSCSCIVWKI